MKFTFEICVGTLGHAGLVVSMVDCGTTGRWFESTLHLKTDHLDFLPVVHDSLIKSLVCPAV